MGERMNVDASTREAYAALSSAVRLRILRLTRDAPWTNTELAAELGLSPATALYHVRRLVRTGFLAAEARRGGREIPYRATGRSMDVPGTDSPYRGAIQDATVRASMAELDRIDPESIRRVVRLRLTLSEEQAAAFDARLAELLTEYASLPAGPGARPWSVLAVVYAEEPTPTTSHLTSGGTDDDGEADPTG
jgi:DNA-binding transcriptional ArsR family regulator